MFVVGPILGAFLNWFIIIGGTLSGLLNKDPSLYYKSLLDAFLFITLGCFSLEAVMFILCKLFGK